MNVSWMRLSIAVAVVVATVGTARTLAGPIGFTNVSDIDRINIIKKDTTKCRKLQSYCTVSCEDSTYTGIGVCQDGDGYKGPQTPMSIECCCCTEGWEHRSFIGG